MKKWENNINKTKLEHIISLSAIKKCVASNSSIN